MTRLNKGEYGQLVYANLGEDVSSGTDLKIVLEPQVGKVLNRLAGDGVAVGTVNVTVGDVIFLANQYLQYTILSGDLNYVGNWRLKGEVNLSSTNKVVSDYRQFEVRA